MGMIGFGIAETKYTCGRRDKPLKRSELKEIIKECLKEVLLEENVLSTVISESIKGFGALQQVRPQHAAIEKLFPTETNNAAKKQLEERRRELLENRKTGEVEAPASIRKKDSKVRALEGQARNPGIQRMLQDPGYDVTNLQNLVGDKWKIHLGKGK